MENQIFPHKDTILDKNFKGFHTGTSQVILLLCPVPFIFWQTIRTSSNKTIRWYGTVSMAFLGLLSSWFSTPAGSKPFPWWDMWEEFCSLVLRSAHFNHSSWKLASRVVLWMWEANCPVLSSESRLLCMLGEGQHVQKRVLTKAFTVFLNKKETLHTTNFSWSSSLRWVSPPWGSAHHRGNAYSRVKKHPPTLSQHSSDVTSYLKKLSANVSLCLWTVTLVMQCQRTEVFLIWHQPALLRDVQCWSE